MNFECPALENIDLSYNVLDTFPETGYVELEISDFVGNIGLDQANDLVSPEIDEILAEQWATGEVSVFLDDFLAGEQAENTGYFELLRENSESVLEAVVAASRNNRYSLPRGSHCS